jgi:hypothetical protein
MMSVWRYDHGHCTGLTSGRLIAAPRRGWGAYNVDNVLKVMVGGLEPELAAQKLGKTISAPKNNFPSGPSLTVGRNCNVLST